MTISPWTVPPLDRDLVTVDLFCGGGGTSLGIEWALGKPPTIAVNHDPDAIETHAANHPRTIHLREDVRAVVPWAAIGGRTVDLLWASIDCTDHSRAKGGKPLDRDARSLGWVVVEWAESVRPRVIMVENVWEFTGWGPLYPADHSDPKLRNRRIPERVGETFRAWVQALRDRGYAVEWRKIDCADFGSPTNRDRLFLIARCDGRPIVWPEPTHGPGRPEAHRVVAPCIDFEIPSLSIFAAPEEARAWARHVGTPGIPRRPLAPATQRRIAAGVKRYVLDDPDPYIVGAPAWTVAPFVANTRNGEREGQAPRVRSVRRPAPTITAVGSQGALVSAFLAKHNGSGERWNAAIGQSLRAPSATITARDTKALVSAHLTKFYGTSTGADLRDPAPTITAGAGGGHAGLVSAFLTAYYGTEREGQGLRQPLRTITTVDRFSLVTVPINGETWALEDIAMRMLQPRELARATGLPEDFVLRGNQKQQTERVGQMVPPHPVAAHVRAQFEGERRRQSSRSGWLFGEAA